MLDSEEEESTYSHTFDATEEENLDQCNEGVDCKLVEDKELCVPAMPKDLVTCDVHISDDQLTSKV